MEINDLNSVANDIMVCRLELSSLEKEREELLASLPILVELERSIEAKKLEKAEQTEKLLIAMRETQLKSWKTEQATYSRATRRTAMLDPIIKKQIEDRLKKGEKVENWELQEKEFVSIRINPTK